MPNIFKFLFGKHKSSNVKPYNKCFSWCACTKSRTTSIVELPTKNLEYIKSKILSESTLLVYENNNKASPYNDVSEISTLSINNIEPSNQDTNTLSINLPEPMPLEATIEQDDNLSSHGGISRISCTSSIETISSIASSNHNTNTQYIILPDPILPDTLENDNKTSSYDDVSKISSTSTTDIIDSINFSELYKLSIRCMPIIPEKLSISMEPNYHEKSSIYYHHNDLSLYYQLRSLSPTGITPEEIANIVSDHHNANDNSSYSSESSELSCY